VKTSSLPKRNSEPGSKVTRAVVGSVPMRLPGSALMPCWEPQQP